MTTTMTDAQVKERIDRLQEKDQLAAALIRLDAVDNVYVVGDPGKTYLNVVAMINYLLERKRLLEAEN